MSAPSAGVDLTRCDTWPKLLQYNSERFGPNSKAMRYKHYGIWQSYSWQDYLSSVKCLALGLCALGFGPGSRLLIVGDNSPEWYFAEMAAQCNRGVSIGLYSDLSAAEIEYIARESEADFAMVEDQEQVDKMLFVRQALPGLKTVVFWRYKGLNKYSEEGLVGLRDVAEVGRRYETEHPGLFEQNIAAGSPDDICAIVYTSGATGEAPKGALHSHRSLMASARCYWELDQLAAKDDFACALPPAWITEQILAFGCHLLCGGTVNFPESAETLQEDVREIAPSVVVYSSRLWENQTGQVQARLHSASDFKRSISARLMPVGGKVVDAVYQRRKPGLGLRFLNALAGLLVYHHVRDSLGLPRARACYSSGSTLSPDALRFFHSLKVPLKNVYGSAEAGLVTGAGGGIQSPGTVGSVNPGTEVSLGGEGEILVRGPGVFLGYCADPDTRAGVSADGWVRTGDAGRMSDNGELVFIDRAGDLITLPSGDILAPQDIESRLRHSPYIRDAWVLAGEDCRFVSAVIIVDADNTGRWADRHKVTYTTFRDLSQKPEVYELIEQEITIANQGLLPWQRIEKFVNLHKEFDPDEFELTRNGKLRRGFLKRRYPELIQALNGDCASIEVEAEFTYQDGRTGKIRTALEIAIVGRGDS